MADRFMVTSKNGKYDGKTLGVKFNNGRAIVDEVSVDDKLGRDVETVADLMKRDHGYQVEPIAHSKMVSVPDLPWKAREAEGVESGEEEQGSVGVEEKRGELGVESGEKTRKLKSKKAKE